jgi:putative addiction module component (TIGR02574 family)
MQKLMESFGLDRLSTAERILLVEELWDSVATSPEAGSLSKAHEEDLQRRLDAHRDNPKAGAPWEGVKARLQETGRSSSVSRPRTTWLRPSRGTTISGRGWVTTSCFVWSRLSI